MKRTWVLLISAALLPLAASAQAVPSRIAQVPAAGVLNQRSQGITVTASGTTSVPATQARITLRLGSRNNLAIYDTSTLQPVIDALVQSGVDRTSIQLPLNFAAPGKATFVTIAATVQHPTVDQMQHGIETVGTAIAQIPGAMTQGAEVSLVSADCDGAQSQARDAAIASARHKALDIAKELNVKVGTVLGITAFEPAAQNGKCLSTYSVSPFGNNGIQQSSDYVTVNVSSTVTITYAIR